MPRARRYHLQARDVAVLGLLSRYACLSSQHIHRQLFDGRAPQVSRRRLHALANCGLVRRYDLPRTLIRLPTGHSIYVLTAAGARRLSEASPDSPPLRVRPLALGTLLHDLGTNHVLLALGAQLSATIVPEPLLRRALAGARQRRPVPARMCVPDGALEVPAGALYLEFVRTAPRGGLSSLIAKLRRYRQFIRSGAFSRIYGHQRVRAVLVLSTVPGRTAHLLAAASRLERGRSLFLFGTTNARGDPPEHWQRPGDTPGPLADLIH